MQITKLPILRVYYNSNENCCFENVLQISEKKTKIKKKNVVC